MPSGEKKRGDEGLDFQRGGRQFYMEMEKQMFGKQMFAVLYREDSERT